MKNYQLVRIKQNSNEEEGQAIERFETVVNAFIKQGFVPVGGVCVSTSYSGFTVYVQAMIQN